QLKGVRVNPQLHRRAIAEAGKLLNEYLAQPINDPLDLRIRLRYAKGYIDDLGLKQREDRIAAAEKIGTVDPWLINMMRGELEIVLAWKARGGGWANTVTEQGWEEFFRQLENARGHLAAAHAAHPEFPEAATKMITVAMA